MMNVCDVISPCHDRRAIVIFWSWPCCIRQTPHVSRGTQCSHRVHRSGMMPLDDAQQEELNSSGT